MGTLDYDYTQRQHCPCCGRWLPIGEFWSRTDRLGHYSWCMSCCKHNGREQSNEPSLVSIAIAEGREVGKDSENEFK